MVDDGGPTVAALTTELTREGVPYTSVALTSPTRPTITPAFLASGNEAFYESVVLPNEVGGSLTTAELTAVHAYEMAFGIRQVDAYTFANPNVGLQYAADAGFTGDLGGTTATVTAAGRSGGWGYLNGPVPFTTGSYAYVAPPLAPAAMPAGATFTPLVTAPIPATSGTGSIVGEYQAGGIDQLVITAAFNAVLPQFQELAHGIVTWATRGVHLGFQRNYLTVQVDDIFNSDAMWDSVHHCTPGEDCPRDALGNSIYPEVSDRMVAADVNALVAWQSSRGFRLQMVFNAGLASDTDPLTRAFVWNRNQFWWVNHTWDHEFLGCQQNVAVVPWTCQTDSTGSTVWVPQSTVQSEIRQNINWASAHGLPFDPSELVSGDYSGLQIPVTQPTDNPAFLAGLTAEGIRWTAADISRGEITPRAAGGALTVPRYPINIFYNADTQAQEVSEYNWLYTSAANGGSGYCEAHPDTTTCIAPLDPATGFSGYIVPLETSLTMGHVLANDPRPTMIHASNLTNQRIILPVLDSILSTYRGELASTAPIVSTTLAQAGQVLVDQHAWSSAWGTAPGSSQTVSGYVQDGLVHIQGAAGTRYPLTVPTGTTVVGSGATFGSAYGGERSAWSALTGGSLTLSLPPGTGYPSPVPATTSTTTSTTSTSTSTTSTSTTTTTTTLPSRPRYPRPPWWPISWPWPWG